MPRAGSGTNEESATMLLSIFFDFRIVFCVECLGSYLFEPLEIC